MLPNGPNGQPDALGAKKDAEKSIKIDAAYAKGYTRLARAYEGQGNLSKAQDALVQGLRHKDLQDHLGLADGPISLQTGGKGFPNDKSEFQTLLRVVLEDDKESAMQRSLQVGGLQEEDRPT